MNVAAAGTAAVNWPDDWGQRLRAHLAPQPDHDRSRWRMGGTLAAPTPAMWASLTAEPKPAAVLVPLIDRQSGPTVLLTVRAPELRQHAGQISFPGGSLEATDADPLAAALRETREEIGVDASYIEPLGFLPDHLVLTGFRITPVVAVLRPGFELRIAGSEVAAVFEMPLAHVLDEANDRLVSRQLRGIEVQARDLQYGEHNIWGATAGMLLTLREQLWATLA
jgi:8-oxo-dGTP pyrophosphatase MutT (NUDIX family)